MTINVSGPWVDLVIGDERQQRLIGGTKGSHIVVNAFPGAPGEALYVEATTDRRPYFIVPWNGMYLIGTTDIRYTGDLDHVVPDEEEIEYLINETNHVVPSANLKRPDVLYAYAGVRPLPYKETGTPGSITRRHIIHQHAAGLNGLISIFGGKITTYRSLAEETTNTVFTRLGRKAPPCTTGEVPLPGGATPDFARFVSRFKASASLDERSADHLLHVYGTRASSVLRITQDQPELRRVIDSDSGALASEIVFAFREEMAQTIDDVLMRRTMIGLNADLGQDALDPALDVAQQHFGWDDQRVRRERTAYLKRIRQSRGFLSTEPGIEGSLAAPE